MYERPADVTDEQVLDLVRQHWDEQVEQVEHVAVGYGAWHWLARTADGPSLFCSLDPPEWHTAESLEASYAGAAALAERLEFVHAPQRTHDGRLTVPLGHRWLSATPYLDGTRPEAMTEEAAALVRRLHAAEPPEGIPVWAPAVRPDLVDELRSWVAEPWDGPLGEPAREAVAAELDRLGEALARYLHLTERLDPATYVTTHGEPAPHNQWRTADGRLLLLDWETIRLAPAERDLLGGVGDLVPGDPDLVRLFRLEWSLDEIRSYSDWLRGPHPDDQDTRTALAALRDELAQAAYSPS